MSKEEGKSGGRRSGRRGGWGGRRASAGSDAAPTSGGARGGSSAPDAAPTSSNAEAYAYLRLYMRCLCELFPDLVKQPVILPSTVLEEPGGRQRLWLGGSAGKPSCFPACDRMPACPVWRLPAGLPAGRCL